MTSAFLLVVLVLLPAAAGFLSDRSLWQRSLFKPAFAIGAPVVYRQEKVSTCPTSDACDIRPAERGELYYYSIVDYLRVIESLSDGRIIAIARDHQRVCLWPNEPGLRKARLTERLIYRLRFPRV